MIILSLSQLILSNHVIPIKHLKKKELKRKRKHALVFEVM